MTNPMYVSVKEAEHLTGIGMTSLYARMKDGTIPYVKVGRRRLIAYETLENLGSSRTISEDLFRPTRWQRFLSFWRFS